MLKQWRQHRVAAAWDCPQITKRSWSGSTRSCCSRCCLHLYQLIKQRPWPIQAITWMRQESIEMHSTKCHSQLIASLIVQIAERKHLQDALERKRNAAQQSQVLPSRESGASQALRVTAKYLLVCCLSYFSTRLLATPCFAAGCIITKGGHRQCG